MTGETKRSWLGMLKGPGDAEERGEVESEGGLWKAHHQAQEGATRLVESSSQILASAARQRTVIDAITELSRNAASRGPEIEEPLERITIALDRLRLVALNVGLEGARLGDPAGRALMNVADEVRSHTERGGEALVDLRTAIEDVHPGWEEVGHRADELREAHSAIVAQAGQQQTVAQDVVREVVALGQHARAISDTDPETALILAQVGEHARGLIQSLGSLGGRARRELVRSALGPSLQPLLRVLLDVAKSSKGDKSAE